MTYTDAAAMVAALGLPCAYYQFPDGTETAPPFLCFYFSGDNDLQADNVNYAKVRDLVIELYTDCKDFALEEALEALLDAHELPYTKSETPIDSERMYLAAYRTSIVLESEKG